MSTDLLAAQQVRMADLLKDPVYRKWFGKVPYLPPACRGGKPWYVYIQREEDGKWARGSFETYAAAYKYVADKGRKSHNFAIVSKTKTYLPPVYRPTVIVKGREEKGAFKRYWTNYPANHNWCPYCRRPTIFREFVRHHAITPIHSALGLSILDPMVRCSICGIRAEGVKQWLNLGR